MPPTPKPSLNRPTFHVWLTPVDQPDADPEDHYLGVVAVTNQDQLMAETRARANGITSMKDQPMAVTNLWLWAALVRLEKTTDTFQSVRERLEFRPVEKTTTEADPDPT